MDLSDAWVVAVVRSGLSGEDRAERWPIVFTRKGLRAAYVHKGQPAKGHDITSKCTRYVRIFGEVSMIGQEGVDIGLPSKVDTVEPHSTSTTDFGLVAQNQATDYDFSKAEKEAESAR